MRTPRFGVKWRLAVFDARVTEPIQTNSDTQTIVLGSKVYSRSTEILQGGIKNVTCCPQNQCDGLATNAPAGRIRAALSALLKMPVLDPLYGDGGSGDFANEELH